MKTLVDVLLLGACLVSAGYGMDVDCNRVGNMQEQDRSYNYWDDYKEYCKIYLKENTGKMTQQNMVYTWQTECLYCFLMIGMREGVPPSKCDNLFCSNENGYAVLINACGIDKVYCIDICLCKCAEQVRKIKNWKQLNIAKKLRDFVANANGMTVDIDAKVF